MTRDYLKLQTFMAIASELSHLGTCNRKKVGAVIVKRGRCISWGYNGAPEGLPHCSENNHGWLGVTTEQQVAMLQGSGELVVGDSISEAVAKRFGCRNATHAEANALAFAARQGISTGSSTLFVTLSPCETCARLLIAAGVHTVHYLEEYRDRGGIELITHFGGTCLPL